MGAVALCAATVSAETVSQKQASKVAQLFSNALRGQVMAQPRFVWNGKKLTTQSLFTPFYVYNMGGGGWVAIAADNKAMPVLGYSEKGSFDADRLTPVQREWLRRYARDIEMIRYDTRMPDQAVEAWGDLQGYIASVVSDRPSEGSGILFSPTATLRRLEANDLTDSYLYTPSQWSEMVSGQLAQYGEAVLGVEKPNRDLLPVAIASKGGDYYTLQTGLGDDASGVWKMRLNATEYLTGGMVADIGTPLPPREETPVEDEPFAAHDEFLAEVRSAPDRRLAQFDELLRPSSPVVTGLGGGHFKVSFPQEIVYSAVCDVAGAVMQSRKYSVSDTANVDLSINPSGFYILVAQGADGTPYSVKLWR